MPRGVPSDFETPTEWNPVGHHSLATRPLFPSHFVPFPRSQRGVLTSFLPLCLPAAGGLQGADPTAQGAGSPLQTPARACSERAGPGGGGGRRERPRRWAPGGAAQSSELRTDWRRELSPQVAGSGAPPRPVRSPCAHRLRPAPGRSALQTLIPDVTAGSRPLLLPSTIHRVSPASPLPKP